MSEHSLHLLLDRGWSGVVLHCDHAPGVMPWCGEYDEYGQLVSAASTGLCWAKEWADEDGVEGCLGRGWTGELVEVYPVPVYCWFNGDGLAIDPVRAVAEDQP